MGSQVSRNEFTYSYTDEPHATRRRLILQRYPQVKKLMGVDPNFKWQTLALTLVQCVSLIFLSRIRSFWKLFAIAYFFGGPANHALMLAIHEISHNAAFGPSRPLANRIWGIIANLPIGLPVSISFRKYHLDHHRYQGDEVLDTDIPTHFEVWMFTNTFRKFIWCILQPFFYTMRPLFVHPKPYERLELINLIVQMSFDFLVIKYLGWHMIAYMIGGSCLAMGLHPVAGHFISEHFLIFDSKKDTRKNYVMNSIKEEQEGEAEAELNNNADNNIDGLGVKQTNSESNQSNEPQKRKSISDANGGDLNETLCCDGTFLIPETCSYYGPLNWVTFNVGYHVEHHDFPSIPGSRLHKLRQIAPEFYDNLQYHTSWTWVLWQYITNPKVGPSARVRRPKSKVNSVTRSDKSC